MKHNDPGITWSLSDPRTPGVHGDSVLTDMVITVFTGTAEKVDGHIHFRTQGQRQVVKPLKTATAEHQTRSWRLSSGGFCVNVCAEPRKPNHPKALVPSPVWSRTLRITRDSHGSAALQCLVFWEVERSILLEPESCTLKVSLVRI